MTSFSSDGTPTVRRQIKEIKGDLKDPNLPWVLIWTFGISCDCPLTFRVICLLFWVNSWGIDLLRWWQLGFVGQVRVTRSTNASVFETNSASGRR